MSQVDGGLFSISGSWHGSKITIVLTISPKLTRGSRRTHVTLQRSSPPSLWYSSLCTSFCLQVLYRCNNAGLTPNFPTLLYRDRADRPGKVQYNPVHSIKYTFVCLLPRYVKLWVTATAAAAGPDPHSAAHNLDRRAGGEKSVFIHVTFFPVIDLYSARVLSDDGRRRFVSERWARGVSINPSIRSWEK